MSNKIKKNYSIRSVIFESPTMILMENPAYGYAVFGRFCSFSAFYYAVVCRVRLLHKAAEYNDIYGKYSELQLKHAVTESKFADVISGAAKAESEKIALQNAVTGLERDLSAQKPLPPPGKKRWLKKSAIWKR